METIGMLVLLLVGGFVGAGYLLYLSHYYSPTQIGGRLGKRMRGK